ncbi:hypothetical protein LEP1GSC047_3949 [Leptospira inadai serovar Lyme str. 10]|uniref:Lipoprotein n=2 Tax=Leptospira inadai serovar Lyme TaxID=293084 RepID=V6HDR2_9LEPT|nr:hypothetical protein [Leptospira inadai]EQA37288.1 hypothetical protein LEP1GSC047_3949 [Leptospira inadai serovar Lyme str. 10]PNV75146.1 hypothetical protein BES34_009625 [Leptospira inadai serovar Lyme]
METRELKRAWSKFIFVLLSIFSFQNCAHSGESFTLNSFFDQQNIGGLRLFNIFDNYPSIKAGFRSLDPIEFNQKMQSSFGQPDTGSMIGFLRGSSGLLLKSYSSNIANADISSGSSGNSDTAPVLMIQDILRDSNFLLGRVLNAPNNSLSGLEPWLEKVRYSRIPILRNLSPINQSGLFYMNSQYDKQKATDGYTGLAASLSYSGIQVIFSETEDVLNKALTLNSNARSALQNILLRLADPTMLGDSTLVDSIVSTIGEFGRSFSYNAGFNGQKTSQTVLKDLVYNFSLYFTSSGLQNGAAILRNYYGSSTNFNTLMSDAYSLMRNALGRGGQFTKDPNVLLAFEFSKNLYSLGFLSNSYGIDASVGKMIRSDFSGKYRDADSNAQPLSALETLIMLLVAADSYGYRWASPSDSNTQALESSSANGGPMTGGVLTVGDAIYSLHSNMTGSFGLKSFLDQSSSSQKVFKNGSVFSFSINSPTVSMIESGVGGIVPDLSDPVYTKTIPFMMRLMRKVVFSGAGPYYNKNRKDAQGNFLTIDGTLYKTADGTDQVYQPTWNSSEYRIQVQYSSSSLCKWVGPGGREAICAKDGGFSAVSSGTNQSGTNGWSIPVWEISKTDDERAVNSDEEALYKNYQWLLYEKRMIVVVPILASLGPSVPYKMGAFVTVAANGLQGLINSKPILSASSICSLRKNAVWSISGGSWKSPLNGGSECPTSSSNPSWRTPGIPVTQASYSSKAGDSMFYLEVWDYGIAGTSSISFNSVGDQSLFNIFYPGNSVPSLVPPSGVIPGAIAANFPVIGQLGFLTPAAVVPENVNVQWENRNRLLPIILTLARTLDDQSDATHSKNPFEILIGISRILIRPLVQTISDQAPNSGNTQITVVLTDSLIMSGTDNSGGNSGNQLFSVRNNLGQIDQFYFRSTDMTSTAEIRTPLSLLIESDFRYQDGLLNILSQSIFFSSSFDSLARLGSPTRAASAGLLFSALADFFNEVKITSDVPAPTANQFNLQAYFLEIEGDLAPYSDPNSHPQGGSTWNRVGDWAIRFRDYLSDDSVFSILPTLRLPLDLLGSVPPDSGQISFILDMVASLLKNSNGAQDYLITKFLSKHTPDMLNQLAGNASSINNVLYAIVENGLFFSYLEDRMSASPYSISDLLKDINGFLISDMIQRKQNDLYSLPYSIGTFLGQVADILERGPSPFLYPGGATFYDDKNANPSGSYWNVMSQILTR